MNRRNLLQAAAVMGIGAGVPRVLTAGRRGRRRGNALPSDRNRNAARWSGATE